LADAAQLTPWRATFLSAASGGRWLNGDRLFVTTLAISIVLHAFILVLRFKPFDFDRLYRPAQPLEVALVNARTESKPTKADVLAQANLDGGGNTDAEVRAKSPLPVTPERSPAQQVVTLPEKLEALEQQTKQLLATVKAAPRVLPEVRVPEPETKPEPEVPPTPEPAPKPDEPAAGDILNRSAELVQLEAQIARRHEAYQQRPKRRFIGARAQEYRFARYVEDWRMKIERVGNLNYPEAARQQRLYGSLLVTVSIRADGSVETVEINRTSGKRVLDAAVTRIIELSAPFAPFPPDISRDTDILHITRTWTFARGDSFVGQ